MTDDIKARGGRTTCYVSPQIHAWVVRQTEQEDWKPVQAERGCARCGAPGCPYIIECSGSLWCCVHSKSRSDDQSARQNSDWHLAFPLLPGAVGSCD